MRTPNGRLLLEMAAIIAIAALVGLVWNHRFLRETLLSRPTPPPAPSIDTKGVMPIPCGLQQAREIFERKEGVFVDARDKTAFTQGRIAGAVSLPVGEFDSKLAEFLRKVPVDSTVVVYCSGFGCHDSMTVGKKLISAGYRKVLLFEGGYPEWKAGGLPVEGLNQ